MEPVDVLSLDAAALKDFLNSFDHVFSDCDGVIWEKAPLPGSGEFFKLMTRLGKTVNFVSNNSIRTRENYERMFAAAGIENGFERLTIPSTAIAEYLKSHNFNKKVYCVSCPETVRVLEANGFQCETGPQIGPDFYVEYSQYLADDEEVGAVVFDSDFQVNLPKMYKAITYLQRPGVLYLNGATDRYVPLIPGRLSLGIGIFGDIVSQEAKREPVLLGKPGKAFGEFAMKRAGVTDASRVLFIGDMIEQDIGLGIATGFKTMLVMTSATHEKMMSHPTIRPNYYAKCLGSVVPVFKKLLK
ncbi:phosphoglycolate phosphatase 1A, chloroplastic-like [Aricia agestis]|uniref:phosphoglycolate phosphatase 1A, chloroplastic-like n=1 Tax=Aricia agestis TaxID=91739 RepID=UPI001C206AE6|nr:phosphoglycolate phosphatase 1A, chloroplastic-like [Aricia agestis]